MGRFVYLTACAVVLSGFYAAAATVVPYTGDVFVSQGHGFRKIGGPTAVTVGDSVMVSPNGLAQIQLDDGNSITVSPGYVLSVPAKVRPKDTSIADDTFDGLAEAGALLAGGAAVATALATSGGGGAPLVAPHPASP